MSSIFGHALVGAAIGSNIKSNETREKTALCLFYAALSIAPDLDYLPTWFAGLSMEPRYSHSIGGCFFISVLGLVFARLFFTSLLSGLSVALIFLSPLSHILLDFMVGVHKNPLFWPFSSNTYSSSFGVLPSAGRLNLTNFYLWRNFAIETGVLLPVALLISAAGRKSVRNNAVVFVAAILSFIFCGYIAHGLHR
jgi:inner membrane protein